jgi:hypothetical protein
MRKTELPEEVSIQYTTSLFQEKLDAFWNLIEDKYEDEWRMEYSGALNLRVDPEFLEQILFDNYAEAWLKFGAWAGGRTAEGENFLLDMPLNLCGLYSITGIYNERQALVDGPRSYYFEPEGI